MAGLVPAIPMIGHCALLIEIAGDKPGYDESSARVLPLLHGTRAVSPFLVLDRIAQDADSLDFDLFTQTCDCTCL